MSAHNTSTEMHQSFTSCSTFYTFTDNDTLNYINTLRKELGLEPFTAMGVDSYFHDLKDDTSIRGVKSPDMKNLTATFKLGMITYHNNLVYIEYDILTPGFKSELIAAKEQIQNQFKATGIEYFPKSSNYLMFPIAICDSEESAVNALKLLNNFIVSSELSGTELFGNKIK